MMLFRRSPLSVTQIPLLLGLTLLTRSASAQSAPAAPASPSYTLAGIDIFGATKTPESVILGILDVKEGVALTHPLVTALDQKLRSSGKFAFSQVSSTDFGNLKSYLSVDVVEKGEEKRLHFNPAPTGDVAVPQDLLDWVRRYEKASFQLFQVKPRTLKDINDGHYMDTDPGLREYQEKMVEMVPQHYDVLVKALLGDKDPGKRVACATLLGYSKDKKAVIVPLEEALKDPNVEVRISAARSLVPIAYLASHTAVLFPLDPVLEMLHYPTGSDRTKAVAVLLQLSSDAANHPAIRERGGDVLVQMAGARQPAQREHSVTLLTIVTGEQYGKDAAKWKGWWKTQKAGTWKPPKKAEPPSPPPSTVKS